MSGLAWFCWGFAAGVWFINLVDQIAKARFQKPQQPAQEHLRVPLGFTADLAQRETGREAKYVRLEGRWLILVSHSRG